MKTGYTLTKENLRVLYNKGYTLSIDSASPCYGSEDEGCIRPFYDEFITSPLAEDTDFLLINDDKTFEWVDSSHIDMGSIIVLSNVLNIVRRK